MCVTYTGIMMSKIFVELGHPIYWKFLLYEYVATSFQKCLPVCRKELYVKYNELQFYQIEYGVF